MSGKLAYHIGGGEGGTAGGDGGQGGGAGGATAARYIAKDSKGAIDVTLVEPTRSYYTCFFSNLYLGGFKEFDSIGHTYGKLANEYGINVVHDWAVDVDSSGKSVTLAGGGH